MAEGFGLKIALEGEREFKAALRDINASFKVLGSEMKLVDSQFAKNDNSTEKLAARNQVLGREIEAQKAKIATLRDALENASSSFGESDRRTQNWQVQLNHAQATLNNLEREVKDNNAALAKSDTEMGQAASAANELEQQLDQAGDEAADSEGKFSKLSGVAKAMGAALGAAFVAVGTASVAAAKGLSSMAVGSAAYADDILTTSTVTGVSAEKLQAYTYAAELVDVSVETMTKSMGKNIKSMAAAHNGTKLAVEAYKKLGISVTDSSGQLRDSETVYWEAIDALGKIPNETERDAIAFQLFGKSAQELNPLIEQGSAGMAELTDEAKRMGAVLSDETLEQLGRFDDSIQRLKAGGAAAKNALGTVLLPQLQLLADDGVNLLGEFTKGLVEADGDWAKISEVMSSTVQDLASSLLSTLPSALQAVEGIMGGLGSALMANLPLLVESATQIVVFLVQALIAALPGLTEGALQLVLGLVDAIIANLPMLLEAALQMIATLATGLAQALPSLIPAIVQLVIDMCATIIENLPLILDAALQLVMGLAQGLLAAVPVLVEALPGLITAIIDFIIVSIPLIIDAGIQLFTAVVTALPEIITAIVEVLPQIIDAVITGLLGNLPLLIDAGVQLFVALIGALPDIITTIVDALPQIIAAILGAVLGAIPQIITAGVQLLVALVRNLPAIIRAILSAVGRILAGILGAIGGGVGSMVSAGYNLLMALIRNIGSVISSITSAARNILSSIVNAISGGVSQMANVGSNLVRGLWNGIQGLAGWLWNRVSSWCADLWEGILGFFGIHSPSKEMAWVGQMLTKGLAAGISATSKQAVDAATDMAAGTLSAFDELAAGVQVPVNIHPGAFEIPALELPVITTFSGKADTRISQDAAASGVDVRELIDQTARAILGGVDIRVVLDDGTLVGKLTPAIDKQLALRSRRAGALVGGVYA